MLHDPDGLIVLEEEDVREALEAAVSSRGSAGRPTSGWSTARSPAVTSRRPPTSTCGSRWRRWSGSSGPEHCPARHDFGLRYLREDLPADVADRVESLVPGHSSRSLRELSELTFAWIDELLAQR